jgi:YggT family protein
MSSLHWLIDTILEIYMYLIIAAAVLSWLIAFDVVNTRNRIVYTASDFLNRVTRPVLAPIRRILPNLGGVDVSPIIVILLLMFIRTLINNNFN